MKSKGLIQLFTTHVFDLHSCCHDGFIQSWGLVWWDSVAVFSEFNGCTRPHHEGQPCRSKTRVGKVLSVVLNLYFSLTVNCDKYAVLPTLYYFYSAQKENCRNAPIQVKFVKERTAIIYKLILSAFTHFILGTKEAYNYINIYGYWKYKMWKMVK